MAMKPMTMRELADMGHLIGHSGEDIELVGTRFRVGCSCGYRSTTRTTQHLALEAIVHHLLKAVRAYAATGRPLPDIPAPGARRDTPAEPAARRPGARVRSAS